MGVCSTDGAESVLRSLGDRVARCISGSPDQVVVTISRTIRVGQVVVEDCFDLSDGSNGVQLFAQLSRSRQPLHIPAKVLPKLDGGATGIELELVSHVRVLERDRETRKMWLAEALSDLTEREMIIIRERRLVEEGVTLETLGRKLGVSKERVRQIEHQALRKLRCALTRIVGDPEEAGLIPST